MRTCSILLLAVLASSHLGARSARADTAGITITSPEEGAEVHTNAQGKYAISGRIKYTFLHKPVRVRIYTQAAGDDNPIWTDMGVTLTDNPATRVMTFSKVDVGGENGACKCWATAYYLDSNGDEQELFTSEKVNYTIVKP